MRSTQGRWCVLMLLHVILLLSVHYSRAGKNLPEICNELSAVATGPGKYTEIVSRQSNVVCRESAAGIVVWSHWTSKRNAILRVVIRRCPRVERMWIMTEDGAHFLPTSSNVKITSCTYPNDTVVVPGTGRSKEKLDIHTLTSSGVNIVVLIAERDGASALYTTHKYHLAPQSKHRHHRARRDAQPKPEPASDDTTVSPFPLSQCGKNRTCVRYGSSGCDHMTCDYFLSYHVMNSDRVDLELSGKSKGWVAVGFSSDAKMGGDDDVIACKLKDELTNTIQVASLTNIVAHAAPEPKPSALTLKHWQYKDGYIYCRVTRLLKVNKRNNLDFSNDWFQLYARGSVGSSGVMLQHDKTPFTSDEKITMLMTTNKFTSSTSSRHLYSIGLLCLVFSRLAVS
ncbi:ferric-chelate reductase 1-like [Haliotis cracherodii]|uniref:ferric-chelate reductase 1-like n=1 Tax=Haliotis cracherodii TaxID=6455 RepID=UPI0039E961AE